MGCNCGGSGSISVVTPEQAQAAADMRRAEQADIQRQLEEREAASQRAAIENAGGGVAQS